MNQSQWNQYFTGHDCREYQPVLNSRVGVSNYEPGDYQEEAEEGNCDSCIYFDNHDCKLFK